MTLTCFAQIENLIRHSSLEELVRTANRLNFALRRRETENPHVAESWRTMLIVVQDELAYRRIMRVASPPSECL